MARTVTVDTGDELREFIDSRVRAGDYRTRSEMMRDLLAEGISSGKAASWNKDVFLRGMKARTTNERD